MRRLWMRSDRPLLSWSGLIHGKGVKGYCSPANREIVIKSGMSEMQTVKTAIHETAHSILHIEHQKEPASMEVEAESIAYVVCQHFGLDTSDYSFGYLAGWSSGKELPELKASSRSSRRPPIM